MRLLVALTVLGLASRPALAAWPDDISLSSLPGASGDLICDNTAGDNPDLPSCYETVVREMGVAIANKGWAPADSLGVNGFELEVSNTIAFISSGGPNFADVGPWDAVHEDQNPRQTLWIPRIQARKGLPFSVDVGGQLGWVATSRQTVFGGYARWSPIEGYRQGPDIALQAGYAGYVGNSQLELGVMDFSGTISYTLPFGSLLNINSASFAPYAGGGKLWIHAKPRVGADEAEEYGVYEVSGFKKSPVYDATDPSFNPWVVHGGFRLVSRSFEFKLSTSWAPKVMPTLNVGMGFTY
ncbi:hypothetical protein L6R46_23000 [Myxococcota bacterium]|nr:hypothetical protein [Myxococcota bacterium]